MSVDTIKSERVPCFVDGTTLIHKRSPVAAVDSDRSVVKQAACCHLFCLLAQWLGVTKTHPLLLKHFFRQRRKKKDTGGACQTRHSHNKPSQKYQRPHHIHVTDQSSEFFMIHCVIFFYPES